MNPDLIATTSVVVHADPELVWDAITNPDKVAQYFFGTKLEADWRVGGVIAFSGEWEGKPYQDKGKITKLEQPTLLEFSYWSNFSGVEDKPENYSYITYELTPGEIGNTVLTVTQTNFADSAARDHSLENWKTVLNGLKELVEKEGVAV